VITTRRAVFPRACKVSLDFVTAGKRHEIAPLLEVYRGAVNFYIRSLWAAPGRLDGETLGRLPNERTRLQSFHKDQAFKQALAIVNSTKKAAAATGAKAKRPVFKGAAILCHGVGVENGRGSFDLIVRLSTLRKRERITLPARRTLVLNKWPALPRARLVQGCALSRDHLIVWVELPKATLREDGDALGVDIGIAKLATTSDGEILGDDFRTIRDRVRRRTGSRRKRRARKSFRKAAAPWTYRRVRQRIEQLAQDHRVRLVAVDPRGTPRICPECGTEDRRNRVEEVFRCIRCDHSGDADFVGARNILAHTVAASGRVQSPRGKKDRE
jgi:transposase